MEIKEFARKVREAVACELGKEYKVELKEVKKNNGVILHGILVRSRGRNVVPTIYLDTFLEAYKGGISFAEIIRRLVEIYQNDTPKSRVDMEFFKSFDEVKDRICYRLISRNGNEELLEDVPYIEFLDLALCFYYAYQGEILGEGTILVYHSHLEMWNTSIAELLKYAQSNTPRLFPWECSSLEEVLMDMMGLEASGEAESLSAGSGSEGMLQVLSNGKRAYGAVCMIYPGVLEEIAAKVQKSLYILPSSIHEVILLTDLGEGKAEELKEMILEVNSTQVAPEEVLSNSLYYYDFADKRVKIIF